MLKPLKMFEDDGQIKNFDKHPLQVVQDAYNVLVHQHNLLIQTMAHAQTEYQRAVGFITLSTEVDPNESFDNPPGDRGPADPVSDTEPTTR